MELLGFKNRNLGEKESGYLCLFCEASLVTIGSSKETLAPPSSVMSFQNFQNSKIKMEINIFLLQNSTIVGRKAYCFFVVEKEQLFILACACDCRTSSLLLDVLTTKK